MRVDIGDYISRYGRVKMVKREGNLLLISDDVALIAELQRRKELKKYILAQIDAHTVQVEAAMRGHVKQALVEIGYPPRT